ncbi:DUF4936 family protein [Oxalobacteraceae bacterium CAVE-383]|nr:DUF4936 family protein [Oxalobacteraceae bacterium CAVE-383]
MDLYIYYRVARTQAAQLQAKVHAMQAQLRHEHGITAALKRRPRPDNGPDDANPPQAPDTWMEVYLAVPDDFENTVDRAFDAAGYSPLIDGTRHIEYFLDCTPCV